MTTTATNPITLTTSPITIDGGIPATLVSIEIEGGVCAPDDLKTLSLPDVPGTGGVILSGRAPVWLFVHLAHHWHVTQWVGTFDPRAGGAIVTSVHSHLPFGVGDVVAVPN